MAEKTFTEKQILDAMNKGAKSDERYLRSVSKKWKDKKITTEKLKETIEYLWNKSDETYGFVHLQLGILPKKEQQFMKWYDAIDNMRYIIAKYPHEYYQPKKSEKTLNTTKLPNNATLNRKAFK